MQVTDGGTRNLGSVRLLCIATAYQVNSGPHSPAEVYHSVYYSLLNIRYTHLISAKKKRGVCLRERESYEMLNIYFCPPHREVFMCYVGLYISLLVEVEQYGWKLEFGS